MSLRPRPGRWGAATIVAVCSALLAAACSSGSGSSANGDNGSSQCRADDCIQVTMSVSSEKIDLLSELVKDFNATRTKLGDKVIAIDPVAKASGAAAQQLAAGWAASNDDPQPDLWTPASSAWGAIVNQQLADKGQPAVANDGTSFMSTPLVIAMPKPMAQAIGWPDKPVGWSDVLALANNPQGWSAFGHPEWGSFKLGKTNPNFSTSGLSALVAQNYAALGKQKGMTLEDLSRPDVDTFDRGVESAVVHYGDTTLTFLNNLYRADQRGAPLSYASAVAVEEKSVIDYNLGNPDGKLDAGEVPRPPRVPLVAVYPKEGTVLSDNPMYVLSAPWVTNEQRDAAAKFVDFIKQPASQAKVLARNFRPGNPQVAVGDPITPTNGVDPAQPQTLLQQPSPPVMVDLLKRWTDTRKPARVLLVVDVSGSMGDKVDANNTKLDLAEKAAADSLDQFRNDDLVGLRIFSTHLGPSDRDEYVDVEPIGPIGSNREKVRTDIRNLEPVAGTPLYDVALKSVQSMSDTYDDGRINAVVLLTDGRNEDNNSTDDKKQLNDLVTTLQNQAKGEGGKPVRLFTIGYGRDADADVLQQMADAASGAYYNAGDPTTINKIFTQVISNF